MPRGDRTGPMGAGPMTGRRAGWCANPNRPGYINRPVGFGLGFGNRGGGRGWRNMVYATGLPGWTRPQGFPPVAMAADELVALKAQATWLAGQLEAIQESIEQIESRDVTPGD